MKVVLMDDAKLVELILPGEVYGNYWIVNTQKENLVNIEAIDGAWVLKSNSDMKIFRNGNPLTDVHIENEKFYTIKNTTTGKSYVIYVCPIYDENAIQLNITLEDNSSWYIGNNIAKDYTAAFNNIISYEQNGFARNQLKLTYNDGKYTIYNLNPQIPMYINGVLSEAEELEYGDTIFILGYKLSLIRDIFYMNNPNKLVKYDAKFFTTRIIPGLDYSKIPTEPDPQIEMYKKEDYFLKPPRFDERIEEKTLEIDPPPSAQNKEEMPAMLQMGTMLMTGMTSITTGVTALITVFNNGMSLAQALPSLITALVMMLTMLILPLATKIYTKHRKKVYERKRQATYSAYVDRKREEFLTEIKREQQLLIEKYIPLKEVADIILYKKRNLWEKNLNDYDFLSLRLGIGAIPPFFKVSYPAEHFSMEDEDNLMGYLRDLEKETKMLENVPVTYSFKDKYVTGLIGSKNVVNPFLKGLLLQMIAFHGYDTLKIVVFTNDRNTRYWGDIIDSPYFWDDQKSIRYFGTNSDDIAQISSNLEEMIAVLKENSEGYRPSADKEGPKLPRRYVIITDDIDAVRNVSIIRNVLESPNYQGISLIICTDRLNSLPNEVEHFISVDEKSGGVFEKVLVDDKKISFIPDFMFGSLEKYSYILSNIPIPLNGGKFVLPTTYTFLEMYNVSNVNQLNALNKWKENNPINSLAAPVGVNEYGELFKLDLHEKYHGPHGLIAGMTGSGKSEFIITFILSMAVNYHPDEVQFVLIDYKGGGLAGAFENRETGLKLPHLAGTITNLDVNEINRSLASLQSELKRRQAEFNKARDAVGESTIDIYKYQRYYRNGQVQKPISHLFIISDEFAELKAQQPDFMSELISTARIGRSLGVHLILATQKPSGVVNDQIWSNSKFKICLKVQDRSDSQEMIKRPDAASIKETGRFFLQVGYDEYFALGQSAWTGAPYYESDVRKKKVDNSIAFVNYLGVPFKTVDDGKNGAVGVLKGEELPNIMKYLVEVSKKENIHVKQLWLNALPPIIYIDGLKEKYEFKKVDCDINPVIGEYDAPRKQFQGLLTMPITRNGNWIVYGVADSGKDELINSIVYSCITTYRPEELNMYLMDFGTETLRMYRKAPQVGDVILQNDTDKIVNLLKMISATIETRRKLFADYGGDYISYCKSSGKILPNIIVVLNGFELFYENFGDSLFDALVTITRDCIKYGVYFILSCASSNGIRSKLAQYLPNHLVLQMSDKYDYSALLARSAVIPSNILGRGLCLLDSVYEFQSAVPTEKEKLNEFVSEKIKELASKYKTMAPKVPVLPEIVTITECSGSSNGLAAFPIGIEKESLEVRTVDITKYPGYMITGQDAELLKPFSNMMVKQFANLLNKNVYVFDAEKMLSTYASEVSYYDSNILVNFKPFSELLKKMYEDYEKSGFDENSLSSYSQYVCIIAGMEKFKALLGEEYDNLFANLANKIKNMPKISFIIIDSIDNIKKQEYEQWYPNLLGGNRGIWIGEGMGDQLTLKSTVSTRFLSAKIPVGFGYFVDGPTTVLVKLITEPGEEEIEVL